MCPNRRFPDRDRARSSSALVITLAALVLISGLLLIFFNQSTLNRQLSFSSAGQYRADLLAHAALDTITGDLRSEVAAGSTVYTTNGISIYIPKANATVVPFRVGDQGIPNLVKQSTGGLGFWTGGANYNSSSAFVPPIRSVTGNRTDTPSANKRSINSIAWNRSGLLGDMTSIDSPKAVAAYATLPDWVVVTRAGPPTNTTTNPPVMATLSDSSASNTGYAIGRYAYTIYDEGGLLDVNVAGYPSDPTLIKDTDDFATKRGLLPQVNLANILGIDSDANAKALVQWRNQTTAVSANSYTNYVFGATNGFTSAATNDQFFLSRNDLIHYVETNSTQVSTAALQYLGTFSREVNAPSYTPPASGSTLRPATLGSEGYHQVPISATDDQFNPSLINVRLTAPIASRDSDGTKGVVGEPLLKYRFPLSRLGLFGNGNTVTDNGSGNIAKFFGLTRVSAANPWVYRNGASSILTLSQVAAAGREPDFFELLQAGIFVGSLGKASGGTFAVVDKIDFNVFYQVMQIGANLIDQYDTDSIPTRILFGSSTSTYDGLIFGVENLPYIAWVYEVPYRSHIATDTVGIWYQPEIWNPHAQAQNLPSAPTPNVPSKFQFVTIGTATGEFTADRKYDESWSQCSQQIFPDPDSPGAGITFFTSATHTYSEPELLSPAGSAVAVGNNYVHEAAFPGPPENDSPPGADFVGIWVGSSKVPNGFGTITSNIFPGPFVNHLLRYWDSARSSWVTYSEMRNITSGSSCDDGNNFATYQPRVNDLRSDPTTDRFGTFGTSTFSNTTIRPDGSAGREAHVGTPAGFNWTVGPGAPYTYFGYLSQNLQSNPTRYPDPDSIPRRADGAYTVKTTPTVMDGLPLWTGNLTSRPLILNRPFRSVAEMGYASRGMPWKHLDFFTRQSADAALLDLFCVDQPPAPSIEAGRVNLNTKQTPVLAAILQGALRAEDDAQTLSSTEATSLASLLTTLTAKNPLLNRSELVTQWISTDTYNLPPYNLPADSAPNVTTEITKYASSTDEIIKRRREAAVRALADVGNTRTWNLLIDVIAQSGRYAPSAANLNQFLVSGEKRYWLHVAIDRYTGKIVAQSLEPVYD